MCIRDRTSTILISGETGTGKELIARAIHHNSSRRHHRFVALNCGAVPDTLLEAELFGHVRGAFTGADNNRQGRIEKSHKRTFILDEVGTMITILQAKLLRVLQEREFERVGDTEPIRVDVRIVAATNSDLSQSVKEGTFRQDLFYRLNVIPMHLPALRDRREDIPLLVQSFLEKLSKELVPPRTDVLFSQDAMRCMMAFDWPGNVRQLENLVERVLALTPGRNRIDTQDLPPEIQETGKAQTIVKKTLPEAGIDLQRQLQDMEREMIQLALERAGGNKNQAARILNIKRTTLVEKTKRLRL